MRQLIKSENGFAALIALIMVAMLTLLGLAALSTSDDEVNIAGNELQEMRAFYAAEAGMEMAAAALLAEYDSTGVPPTVMPSGADTLNQTVVTYTTVDDGAAVQDVLTNGPLAGLHALVKSFTISSVADNPIQGTRVEMSQTFETALVPIFQFAVFYDDDLEIAPGPDMTLGGRVHSNSNIYLQAGTGNSLKMDSYVTAAGGIYHGPRPGGSVGTSSGDVLINDASDTYVSMKEGLGWLDANDAHWYDSSLGRWGGRVQDSKHGQTTLNVPLAAGAGSDPHKLIEPAGGNPDSYENLATLKIIDRTCLVKVGGVWQDVTADMVSKGIVTFNDDKFTDQREGVVVDVMDLDIEKMYDEGYAPSNGVIYYSDQTAGADFPAMRVCNAEELDAGLTITSENPVYTWGDFNSDHKKPAAILADAITFLSDQWDDNESAWLLNNRSQPVNTTVNASYMTGNVETTGMDYSGGFENLPRFLEKWSGRTLTWSGSAVSLWNSVQANSPWSYGTHYEAPNRNWTYDTDLNDPNKLPPQTPVFRVFQSVGWKQEYVGYDGI